MAKPIKEVVAAVDVLLEHYGIARTEEAQLQLQVFLEAVKVMDSRMQSYGTAWKQYGAMANLLSMARKTDRIMAVWWHTEDGIPKMHKDNLDDAMDLLNYTVFFIRLARDLEVWGDPPIRPADPEAVKDEPF